MLNMTWREQKAPFSVRLRKEEMSEIQSFKQRIKQTPPTEKVIRLDNETEHL